ncbi:hypothetical protein SLE2022_351570 [Rubroshorea leprosula]
MRCMLSPLAYFFQFERRKLYPNTSSSGHQIPDHRHRNHVGDLCNYLISTASTDESAEIVSEIETLVHPDARFQTTVTVITSATSVTTLYLSPPRMNLLKSLPRLSLIDCNIPSVTILTVDPFIVTNLNIDLLASRSIFGLTISPEWLMFRSMI